MRSLYQQQRVGHAFVNCRKMSRDGGMGAFSRVEDYHDTYHVRFAGGRQLGGFW